MSLPVNAQDSTGRLISDLAAEINLWRLNVGLSPLVYNETLELMAALQADYLMTLSDIPAGGDIHTGAQGEDARARSQFPQFSWPTYGHPQRISLTEIAGVGSINSAMNFWRNSDLHRRSATNPAYREIGIAARTHGTDTLFIVVLGGRPNVVPALVDAEVNEIYLSTELNEWEGEWIGDVTQYRILNRSHQVVQSWQDWDVRVPLPENVGRGDFYIEYEDAAGHRSETEVVFRPVWSSIPFVQVASVQSEAGQPVLVLATNTPFQIPTMTPMPTATQIPDSVLLIYNPRLFTLVPQGALVDLSLVSFRNSDSTFAAVDWEAINPGLNVGALPRGNCVQIGYESGPFGALPECSYVRSVIYEYSENDLFWTHDTFDVLVGEEVVATCEASARRCEFNVP